jgi:Indole-3-glycerol phosphate synthase
VILSRILEHKKAELRHKQSRGYLSELKAKIQDEPGPLGFTVTLDATRTAGSPALIAEVKKASPSLGLLRPEFSIDLTTLRLPRPIMPMAPRRCPS